MARVVLRRIVVDPDPVIERKITSRPPGVLDVELGVGEQVTALRPRIGFGVCVVIAQQRVGIGVVGVEQVDRIAIELDGPARSGAGGQEFLRPLEGDPGLDGVGFPHFAQMVAYLKDGVAVEIGCTVVHGRVGGVADAAEGHVRNEPQRIERRVPRRNIDPELVPVHCVEIFGVERQGVLADADQQLVEHGRRNRVLRVHRCAFARLVEYDRGQGKIQRAGDPGGVGRVLLVGIVLHARIQLPVRARSIIDAAGLGAARITAASGGKVVRIEAPRRHRIDVVRQREQVQNGLAGFSQPRSRNQKSGKRFLSVERIVDSDERAIGVVGLRKIALALERGGYGDRLGPVLNLLMLKFL